MQDLVLEKKSTKKQNQESSQFLVLT